MITCWLTKWESLNAYIPGKQFAGQDTQLDTALACHAQDWKDVC